MTSLGNLHPMYYQCTQEKNKLTPTNNYSYDKNLYEIVWAGLHISLTVGNDGPDRRLTLDGCPGRELL